jgi:formylglycine-generating enzyme required for sulfatase activity
MRAFNFLLALLMAPATAFAVTIDTVPVGDAGNFPIAAGYGGVPYEYRIGRTEVTNAQYVEFLNAVAKSDPRGLYNTAMATASRAGITRSGSSPNYTYSVKENYGNKPANLVSFWDAARFVNWLHNGQPTGSQGPGTTEDGAYALGGVTNPVNESVVRNPAAKWFIPSDDEWYKAAYYQPADQDGDMDDYWLYPYASNIEPTPSIANAVGDITNPGPNVATVFPASNWGGSLSGNVTTVASAGPLSQSFYGTFDQAGNVTEWTETITSRSTTSTDRAIRGGTFLSFVGSPSSQAAQLGASATLEDDLIGFRIAQIAIPAPLAGDFNNDGVVGAADYVVWRDGLGVSFAPADYWVWRSQFGKTVASTAISAIPEPAAWLLLTMGGLSIIAAWNSRRQRCRRSAIRSICLTQALAAIAGMVQAQPSIAANFSSQVVAMRGTAAPDGNGVFAYFGIPALNDNGQIAFSAGLAATNGGIGDNTGIFRGDSVALSQLARKGQATPGGNGHFLNFVEFVDRGPRSMMRGRGHDPRR